MSAEMSQIVPNWKGYDIALRQTYGSVDCMWVTMLLAMSSMLCIELYYKVLKDR